MKSTKRDIRQVFFTVDQVAEMTQLSRSYIYKEIASGRLPVTRFGRAIRIKGASLKPWVDAVNEQYDAADGVVPR